VDEEVPLLLEAETLRVGDAFTFVTDAGHLDVLGTPSGTDGFEDLFDTATMMDLDGLSVPVADIEDLIRMKRAAARPKDRIEAEVLAVLQDELDR
jgi:hypothetical protein